jgi:nucleotide-binding universal stress UspA family protein
MPSEPTSAPDGGGSPVERAAIDVAYEHVLVPLDGSALAAAAFPTARAIAERLGAEVHAIAVASSDGTTEPLREEVGAAISSDSGHARVRVVVGDDPAAAIVGHARELGSTLVCMSTHGRGRVAGAVVGSVARSVFRLADAPIVVVGPFADRPPPFTYRWPDPLAVNRLVACVDGAALSEQMLPVAAGWAKRLGASLSILTVVEPAAPVAGVGRRPSGRYEPDGDPDVYVARLAEQWRTAGIDARGLVVHDPISPAEGVKAHLSAEMAGLVIVTTHARSGLRRVLLGADAAAIIRASLAPVLVVPLGVDSRSANP